MRKTKFLKAFTLAEVLATVVILGVIAAITIPSTLHRVTERQNKTRVRKAMTTYQTLVEKMIIENNIGRSNQALNQWANGDGNCTNARRYLKGTREGNSPCIFRSADGLWYNITNISETIIGFDNHGQPTNVQNNNIALSDENKAFALVTSFDQNGSIRVQDQNYETNANTKDGGFMKEGAKSWATRKVECYLNNENCNRDRDICVGNAGNERCLGNFTPIGNGCLTSGGSVLRVDGRWVRINVCGDRVEQTFTDKDGNVTGRLTCNNGACFVNNGSYMCETVGNRVQCHINGGEVSDIEYDMNGNVTKVICNSWNASCVEAGRAGATIPSPMTCKTACCSLNRSNNTWETCGREEDQVLFQKAACMLMSQNTQNLSEECKNLLIDVQQNNN